jgi:hypothetical protein
MTLLDPLINDRRGSLGDTVFSRNQHGPYTRARTVPVNTFSVRRAVARDKFKECSTKWATQMTELGRRGWYEYAERLGLSAASFPPGDLSGRQAFFRSNMPRAGTTQPFIFDAPVTPFDMSWTSLFKTRQQFPNVLLVSASKVDPWSVVSGCFLAVAVSNVRPATVNFCNGPWRRAGIILSFGPSTVPSVSVLTDPWGSTVGPRQWLKTYISTVDGHVSHPRIQPFGDNT